MQIMPVPTLMCFNPRPHARGDEAGKPHLTGSLSFNPRPHTRGDRGVCRNHASVQGFNPRPHTRGDTPKVAKQLVRAVSIHAPTRGATSSVRAVNGKCVVSIHAPTRGATMASSFTSCSFTFQSTPPRGGRLICIRLVTFPLLVSIHAPTRGATIASQASNLETEFQSTPPREGRQFFTFAIFFFFWFNPRPHALGVKQFRVYI